MNTPARCVRCGLDVPAGAQFCPGCGLDLRDGRPRSPTGFLAANKYLHNRYLIVQRLAQGGQSAVYLVRDLLDGNKLRAVKEMSESNLGPAEREKAINDFIREAEMLRLLDHQSLAKVFDRFVEGQKHFLVMEYVHGRNLEDELIATGRPLGWERVHQWGMELCVVLAYLHRQDPPIIYRDLKPANVMLLPEGNIKLIDFGIARWLHPTQTHDTAQLGTDGYAPLEQYTARSEPRSDLYALGASLYHLLTGRVPEAAPLRMAGQALTPVRAINDSTPESLEYVVHRALSLRAADRFASAEKMHEALIWAQNQAHPQNRRLHTAPPTSSMPRRTGAPVPDSAPVNRQHATSGPAPRLRVWPLRLDAGTVEPDSRVALTIEISNSGRGALSGHIETNMRCLTVEPSRVTPEVTVVELRIDTSGLVAGPYTGHVAMRTTGGAQIIPVRFMVREQPHAYQSYPPR